uniref:Uncharacterized protein n=1 Tax=Salix viminalis TaxID=40686 RepID=A0A6N2N4Q8_SALVM
MDPDVIEIPPPPAPIVSRSHSTEQQKNKQVSFWIYIGKGFLRISFNDLIQLNLAIPNEFKRLQAEQTNLLKKNFDEPYFITLQTNLIMKQTVRISSPGPGIILNSINWSISQ